MCGAPRGDIPMSSRPLLPTHAGITNDHPQRGNSSNSMISRNALAINPRSGSVRDDQNQLLHSREPAQSILPKAKQMQPPSQISHNNIALNPTHTPSSQRHCTQHHRPCELLASPYHLPKRHNPHPNQLALNRSITTNNHNHLDPSASYWKAPRCM